MPLRVAARRRSRTLGLPTARDRRRLLLRSLCSFVDSHRCTLLHTHAPHTHIHTRARASVHTNTLGRGQSRARARTIRSPRPSCSDPPLEASLSLSLSNAVSSFSHLPPLPPRFLVQPSFALFPPRRPDVSPSKRRGRHKGSLVGKRQAEAFAHARLSLVQERLPPFLLSR